MVFLYNLPEYYRPVLPPRSIKSNSHNKALSMKKKPVALTPINKRFLKSIGLKLKN